MPDFEDALISKLREVRTPEPVADPPVAEVAPAEAPVEPVAAPAETVPAVVPESPSETPAVEVKPEPSEGNTPAVVPDVTPSAREALAKRTYGNDPEKLAAEFLRIESELAARVRAEKAAQAAPVVQPPAPDAAVAAPVFTAPDFSHTEPPVVGRIELPAQVTQEIGKRVAEDAVCRALAAQHQGTEARLAQICQFDANNRVVGGLAADLNSKISELKRILAPTDKLKEMGIEAIELDELQRDRAESRLIKLEHERRNLFDEYQSLEQTKQNLQHQFASRANEYRAHYENQALSAKAEADRSAEITAKEETFGRRWMSEEAAVLKEHSFSAEFLPSIKKAMKQAAQVHVSVNGAISEDDIPLIMREVISERLAEVDLLKRVTLAEHTKAKLSDAASAVPGSPNSVPAPPVPKNNHVSLEESLSARLRGVRGLAAR